MPDNDGPVVLVTGASGAIGVATLGCLRDRGARVIAADRIPLPHPATVFTAMELAVDLADDRQTERAFAQIPDIGALRHVIAIAGGGDIDELRQTDPATEPLSVFSKVVVNNLDTAYVTIRHAVPQLRALRGDRSITLVGSINALGGYGAPGYSAAKAGLIGLSRALTGPLGRDGIRINCVELGTVDTENLHRLAAQRGEELDLSAVAERTPLGRVLTAREVAVALVNTALDMPGLTGSTIVLDNGQSLIR